MAKEKLTRDRLRQIIKEEKRKLDEAASDNQEAIEVLEKTGGIQSVMTLPNAPGMVINFDWGGTLEIQALGDELNLILNR